jgi:hypothetical protein
MKAAPAFLMACASVRLFADAAPPAENTLPAVVIKGRQDSLLGIADSATVGVTGAAQLAERPILRAGELLETVPGLIITQHAGGGKANQYFLRGFNLDHGTDFATFLDGVPLNMPSHGHGQGYADMNVIIPELVERVHYQKGPYFAQTGDFGTAGAAYLDFYKSLPRALLVMEAGAYGYGRVVFADSAKLTGGNLLYGVQVAHSDGPWLMPDDYDKFNGQLTWSLGDAQAGSSITLRAYRGKWNSSDQIPSSLVAAGTLSPFGNMDKTNGGDSRYLSLSAEWHRKDKAIEDKLQVYAFRYDLDLFSNFTYYLNNPLDGDQFEQADRRFGAGLNASRTYFGSLANHSSETTIGLQLRNDWVDNGLYDTVARVRTATTAQHDLSVGAAGLFAENHLQWTPTFRTVFGGRVDVQHADVAALTAADSGRANSSVFSPKLSLVWGPYARTEYFVQAGYGFHSNDARGATQTSGGATPLRGLMPSRGGEVGIRTLALADLQSTLSVWYLRNGSELVLAGDTGELEPSGSSERYGVEWANYYTPNRWLTFDLDLAASQALYSSPDGDGGRAVPESINTVVSAGVTAKDGSGWSGSLRLRYFGPRDLISTGDVRSGSTTILNAAVSRQINERWQATLEVLNLLDSTDQDIAYLYESKVSPAAAPSSQVHFHPVEPRQVRLSVTGRF